jgi:hypothetical protein
MSVFRLVRRLGTGMALVGGAAALLGVGIARADETTVDLNGWTVETDSTGSATLLDPSDSLGNGTQLAGFFESIPSGFDHAHFNDFFNAASLPLISIGNTWESPWLLVSTVEATDGSAAVPSTAT